MKSVKVPRKKPEKQKHDKNCMCDDCLSKEALKKGYHLEEWWL